jgi:chemotaxis regulatin CheY-phosphate phosphatase CheZ
MVIMKENLAVKIGEYEARLVGIVRRLPPERVMQLVDFARFLEAESEEGAEAVQAEWDDLLARPEAKRKLRDMAREAVDDYRAGQVTDIEVTEDGRLAPA